MVKTLTSNLGVAGLIPGERAKIPHALQPKYQNIKQKQYCNKFNKDFKNGPHQKKKNLKKKNNSSCSECYIKDVGKASEKRTFTLRLERSERACWR